VRQVGVLATCDCPVQLQVSSPSDPRLQQFIDKFRASPTFTPEYGGECTGGVGNPEQT